jgi:hypothetical protein
MQKTLSLFFSALFLLVSLAPGSAFAKNLTLAWDANTETGIVGYKLYYKADSSSAPLNGTGAYEGPSPIDIGNATTASLTGLADGRVHYITVTAYNASGQESTYSNIVTSAAVVSDGSNSVDNGSTSDGSNSVDNGSTSGGSDIVDNGSTSGGSDIVDNTWLPFLWYPANGAIAESTPVQLDWEPLPAGSSATYTLYYGTDPYLGANRVAANAVSPLGTPALLAGVFFFSGAGLATRRRRLLLMLMLALLAAGSLLSGCGGGGGSSSDSTTPVNLGDSTTIPLPDTSSVRVFENLEDNTFIAEDLQAGTTYYWKVVAVDGQTLVESDIYSFTTKAN